ncbi:MAG: hypothetical protein MSS25_02595 [Erysipelatoclostridium ramosum]|nr:hypothetical protein [Thomasclavelia ramosa]
MNDKSQNLFTELRFKKSDEVHDSGFACIEVIGYNCVTGKELLLTKYSDVIHLPLMDGNGILKSIGPLSIDISPESEYFRIFVISEKFRIKVNSFIGSDFMYEVIRV